MACIGLITPPPTTGEDDEWDLPVDLGRQLRPEELDDVDLSVPLQVLKFTDEQKAALPPMLPGTKILIVSGQNSAVDDLVPRLSRMWKDLGLDRFRAKPVILRLYSLDAESKDFPRHFAKISRDIQRIKDESTSGILAQLLSDFYDQADAYEREGRWTRAETYSVVDKAIELYQEDSKRSEGRKYNDLVIAINKIVSNPGQFHEL